jgi:regulator of sigma E protease
MLAWIAPVIVFGLVVFVHELGHFLAAKLTGVYAPRFSIGFGPALFRKRWGETEYVLAALPLGGYVRMASREDETMALIEGGGERAPNELPTTGGNAAGKAIEDHAGAPHRGADWDPDAMYPFGPRPVPEHRWFESKSLPARLLILIAGVTMNALLALVVSVGVYASYGRPYLPAVVDSVVVGRPAANAGLLRGDSIVAVNGTPVRTWNEVVERIRPSAGRPLVLEVARGGGRERVEVRPEATSSRNPMTGAEELIGQIGAAPRDRVLSDPVPFGEAVRLGAAATANMATGVVTVVRGLFTGKVSTSNLGGPIAIAQTSVAAARNGPQALLTLIAFLSINVAILNLLPIPVLDGGQILLNVLEAAKGSAFSARTREYILRTGLVAIGLLFVLVMFNDIRALVTRLLG